MSKLILTVGPSSCGKSSWAESFSSENPNTVVISRDDYRYKNNGWLPDGPTQFREHLINIRITKDVCKALEKGLTVIVADTNLSASNRAHWLHKAQECKAQLEYVVFASFLEDLRTDPYKAFEVASHVHHQCIRLKAFLEETPNTTVKYNFI